MQALKRRLSTVQALATHLYQGEDEDELTFEKGDVIYVVPYDDPEDEASPVATCREAGLFPTHDNFQSQFLAKHKASG